MRTLISTISGLALLVVIAMLGYDMSADRERPLRMKPDTVYNISFERTGCYGPCPIYLLLVDAKRHTRLSMEGFVENEAGDYDSVPIVYEWTLPADRHTAIVELIENHGFRTLDLAYFIGVTDMEMKTIGVTTTRGHWSTSVYAVPCKRESVGLGFEQGGRSKTDRFVPDVFCDTAALLHEAACDTFGQGTRIGRASDVAPFHPPQCR